MKRNYSVGNQVVQCNFIFNKMLELGKQYLIDGCNPEIILDYNLNEIIECKRKHNHLQLEQCEYILSLEKYALKAMHHGKVMLHASVIELNEKALIFMGCGGVGKTTQANLWKSVNSKIVTIVSDDRPVVGFQNGTLCVWNTPWSKYQNYKSKNDGIEVYALCFLEQSCKNEVLSLNNTDAIKLCLSQYPNTIHQELKFAVQPIVKNIPCFLFRNNATTEFVTDAYEKLFH